jgi:hypothetical protein
VKKNPFQVDISNSLFITSSGGVKKLIESGASISRLEILLILLFAGIQMPCFIPFNGFSAADLPHAYNNRMSKAPMDKFKVLESIYLEN